MHYYKRNLGDYAKKTGRLSMLEHGAYTLLIDACYDRERFPTRIDAIEWCWARTPEEMAAVDFVLSRFFTLDGDTYVQNRIREEVTAYHQNSKRNSEIAKQREDNRRKRARSVHEAPPEKHEAPPNQEPITINQEPTQRAATLREALFDSFWSAYPKKVGKGDAEKAWRKVKEPAAVLENILTALKWQKSSVPWLKEGGQFVPYPATYLNRRGWEDEPINQTDGQLAMGNYADSPRRALFAMSVNA